MRKRKNVPPGTFIPFPQRLLAILQLCIAFSLILWYASQPFMGEYFSLKSRLLLYEYVMGTSTLLKTEPEKDKLSRNAIRFSVLPQGDREIIKNDYEQVVAYSTRSTLTKIGDGIQALLTQVPAFELAWIFFSIVIAILLLLKIEGAKRAAWLLPCIALAYGVDNVWAGYAPVKAPDAVLFPTEKIIVQDYIGEPLSQNIGEQQAQLREGWGKYLVANWASEGQSLENAEFNFTMARLKEYKMSLPTNWGPIFHERAHYFVLGVYVLWNLFFALIVNRKNFKNTYIK